MIIKRLPFLVSPSVQLNSEKYTAVTEYDNPIQDNFYVTGGTLTFGGGWEKWQLSVKRQQQMMIHYLLVKLRDGSTSPVIFYPVQTMVYPLKTRETPQIYLYRNGIESIHKYLNKDPRLKISFILEDVIERAIKSTASIVDPMHGELDELIELISHKCKIHQDHVASHVTDCQCSSVPCLSENLF